MLAVGIGQTAQHAGVCGCGALHQRPTPLPLLSIPLQRISFGALCVVAAYDGWQSRRLALDSGAAAAKAKELTSQLLAAAE